MIHIVVASHTSMYCARMQRPLTGCAAAGTDTGTDAERNGSAGSDDEQQAQDTPQQRAASRVWDACASAASARLMARHGLLDICTALLEHSPTIGDGACSPEQGALKRSWGFPHIDVTLRKVCFTGQVARYVLRSFPL